MHPMHGINDLREWRFRFLPPKEQERQLEQSVEKLVSGESSNQWTTQFNNFWTLQYKYQLLKMVRANLLFPWLASQFNGLNFVFLIRHPAAVVQSQLNGGWQLSSRRLFAQSGLHKHIDLSIFERFRWPENGFLSNMIFWAIENRVAIDCVKRHKGHIIFYENLCISPKEELTKLEDHLGIKFPQRTYNVISKSSWSSKADITAMTPEEKIGAWKKSISPDNLDIVLQVLAAAGLDNIYGPQLMPVEANGFT